MNTSNPSNRPSDFTPLILPHQRPVFEHLSAIGRTCFAVQRKTIPVRLRTNTLIVGPTGTGKTFLASAVARGLGVPCLTLSVSNWVLLSCSDRGAEITWRSIIKFLYQNRREPGVVIFLDELDKLTGNASWDVYLRVECFGLLDFTLPTGITGNDNDLIEGDMRAAALEMLNNKTFIVGGGAFQHLWESRAQPNIGFNKSFGAPFPPSPDELAQTLPREIINRFGSELMVLRELGDSDYLHMLEATSPLVPSYLRETFEQIGLEMIPSALNMRQGCRFLEDVMLQTLLAERASLQLPSPARHQHPEKSHKECPKE